MKQILLILAFSSLLVSCSGSGGSTAIPFDDGTAAAAATMSGNNVVPLQIGSSGTLNVPVATVTVCSLGNTSQCVTIPNILIDTGSSGLRVFSSFLTGLSLTQVTDGSGNSIARCVNFGDGTNQWGPVKKATVIIGGETVSSVNIEVIDASYKTVPSHCNGAESSPSDYNGILGVGTRDQDCGSSADCTQANNNGWYFTCTSGSSTCTDTGAALNLQVENPIALMDTTANVDGIDDSGGSSIILPSIPDSGVLSASGYLVFGIGTRSNNTPSNSAKVLTTNSEGYFYTTYDGTSFIPSLLDSGSNAFFFPATSSSPNTCSGGWYCPDSTVTLNATHKAYTGGASYSTSFDVIDMRRAFVSNNSAYPSDGAEEDSMFIWGLPYFYGRQVYTSIYGKTVTINGTTYTTSPVVAY
ncbi:MAG TPA: DUF3443 family protein [Bdellovibrio sp.]|uniref:DUF3443 family protein n=1 Tax=Bdellovibrio sp. TaxID=28201 RepID=UPI002F18F534